MNQLRMFFLSSSGSDENTGLDEQTPIKTVDRLNRILEETPLQAGEGIRLRRGDTFTGTLKLVNAAGSPAAPVTVTGYGKGNNPCITSPAVLTAEEVKRSLDKHPDLPYNEAAGEIKNGRISSAVEIIGGSYIEITDVDGYSDNDGEKFYQYVLDASGILCIDGATNIKVNGGFYRAEVKRRIKDYIADVLGEDRELIGVFPGWDASYPPYRGNDYNAVVIKNSKVKSADLSNVVLENIVATGVTTGITVDKVSGFTIRNCRVVDSPCWGITANESIHGQIVHCETNHIGFGLNPNGNAAFMVASCRDVLFSDLKVIDSDRGPQPYDGVAFDFEGGIDQRDITLRNTLIDGCYGPGVMIFTNTDGNQNFLIDNVFISHYSKDGTEEGAVNFCWPEPDNYQNSGTVRDLTVVQHVVDGKPKPFYTLYPSEWKNVKFENCCYISSDDEAAADAAYKLFLQKCKHNN